MMLDALSGKQFTEKEKQALAALRDWDFVADTADIGSTVFHATINEMVKNTFRKRLGNDLYGQYLKNKYVVFNALRNLMATGRSRWFDDPDTAEKEGIKNLIDNGQHASI